MTAPLLHYFRVVLLASLGFRDDYFRVVQLASPERGYGVFSEVCVGLFKLSYISELHSVHSLGAV